MVRSRGSIMAGMRPSNRIPMRTSKDGPFWHTNENRNCDTTQHKMSILRDWNTAQLSKISTHHDACRFSPCPHKQGRQTWHNQDAGEASLYDSRMVPEDRGHAQNVIPSTQAGDTNSFCALIRWRRTELSALTSELWFNNAHIEKHIKILQPITNLQM